MENSLYFAVFEEKTDRAPLLRLGLGFDAEGAPVFPALPEGCAGLVLHDLNPPSEAGAAALINYVNQTGLPVVCDLERPAQEIWSALLQELPARLLTVPEQYAAAPHASVLCAPYLPALPFADWLAEKRRRFGSLVLDLQPLACALRCGEREFFAAAPPAGVSGRVSGALLCRCAAGLSEEGAPTLYFFDDRETLAARRAAADVPGIVLLQEWEALQVTTDK